MILKSNFNRRYLIYYSILLLILLVFFVTYFVTKKEGEKKFRFYIKNLPDNEDINASIYNEELYLSEIKKLYQKKEYKILLEKFFSYYSIFNSDTIDINAGVSYYMHLTLKELSEMNKLNEIISSLDKKDIRHLALVKDKDVYRYENGYLKYLIKEREAYDLELEVIDSYYMNLLKDQKKKTRIKAFLDYGKYYPNSKKLYDFTNSPEYSVLKKQVGYDDQNFNLITKKIINNQFTKDKEFKYAYIKDKEFAILKNVKEDLYFRNLHRFEGWEIVRVYGQSKTIDMSIEKEWFEIEYSGTRGFERKEKFELIDINKFDEFDRIYELQFMLDENELLDAIKLVNTMILYGNRLIEKRAIIIFHYLHMKIKNRATSKNNKYLKYVLKYPKYFNITEDNTYLIVSPLLFNMYSDKYPNDLMRQFFLKEDFNF